MRLDEAMEYVLWVKQADECADFTLRDYKYHLSSFISWAEKEGIVEAEQVTPEVIRKYLKLGEDRGNAVRTINSRIRYLKASFNILVEEGLLEKNPVQPIKLKKEPLDTVQPLSDEVVEKLLAQPDKGTFIGRRNYVCMLVSLDTGIRPKELFGLNEADFQGTHIIIPPDVAKDRERRFLPLGEGVVRELKKYLAIKNGWGGEILFPNQDGGRLKTRSWGDTLNKYAKKAGLEGVKITPYSFRHTFAVNYLRNGGDVFTLQKILGHTTLEMTRIYVQLSDLDVKMLHKEASPAEKFIRAKRRRR